MSKSWHLQTERKSRKELEGPMRGGKGEGRGDKREEVGRR